MTLIQESDLPEAFLESTGIPIKNKKNHKDCPSQFEMHNNKQTNRELYTYIVGNGWFQYGWVIFLNLQI